MDEQSVRNLVRSVLSNQSGEQTTVPIEVSARHVHLTNEAVQKLFGKGAALTKKRDLSQTGEFLSEQRVKLITPKGEIPNVAILGPERKNVQVELSLTDCRQLGIDAPINLSGDLSNAADLLIMGPNGIYDARGAVIVAKAHIHAAPEDAKRYGLIDGSHVTVSIPGKRSITLDDVVVRVKSSFVYRLHIDFDEANACGLQNGMTGIINAVHSPVVQPLPAQSMMLTEELITESMAKATVKEITDGEIMISKATIITPSAKDVLLSARVKVKRGG